MRKLVGKIKTNDAEPYLVYGLSFKTIHDDSRYYDDHKIWFEKDEELRDAVFEHWGGGDGWKDYLNDEYSKPGPNYNHSLTKSISKLCTNGVKELISYTLSEEEYKNILINLENNNTSSLIAIFKNIK